MESCTCCNPDVREGVACVASFKAYVKDRRVKEVRLQDSAGSFNCSSKAEVAGRKKVCTDEHYHCCFVIQWLPLRQV